ncbi:sigma-54 factor interaction domain-containing protein [Vogesella sp. EB]|uniref:sigma-54 interaction domain-containing protein n=1 Tax=Vogesella sp. EB TaxID=1526735 RepID=UPI00064D7099|nr:sigma-54 dependent transcriptional regulator [Vogesella sp. EB]KMJ52758.1 sigma-54 factor interaction domain-containing protein [Vogesella sp. EB]
MEKWLISWIGETDHQVSEGRLTGEWGPIATAVKAEHYDRVHLLTNYGYDRSNDYCKWLESVTGHPRVELQEIELLSPIDHVDIYRQITAELQQLRLPAESVSPTFHLSPGTPAMATIWVLLAKSRFPARLIQTAKQHNGVKEVDISFDLAGDFLPEYLQRTDERVGRLLAKPEGVAKEFAGIVHTNPMMREQIQRAHQVAVHNVPVLVLGETGTGKELFAEAIHRASGRAGKYVAVNCGAIPKELVNSELFGHRKGAFTGADRDRTGHFREASGGTLFLDEIGDLPLDAQVRLLRAIQQGEVTPLGASDPVKVDVRIIAATHRDLMADVQSGRFREDLFHRLAVGIIRLPALRERREDIPPLVSHFMAMINQDSAHSPEWQQKEISESAIKILLSHDWPGNVRELYHTLLRASIWARQGLLDEHDIMDNILRMPRQSSDILERGIGQGFEIEKVLDEVKAHYIRQAMTQAHGKKKDAAVLLGLNNYQTLNNWIDKLGRQTATND